MEVARNQDNPKQHETFLSGGGEMGALMRKLDWSKTPLGPLDAWPQSLRTAVSVCLNSRFPILIWWGSEMIKLYNDAYRPMLGATKHPQAMGQPGRECWPEIWHIIGPMLEGVLNEGQATWSDDQLLLLDRNSYIEECYFTFSYSPIHDESGGVGGVFTAVTETTERVIGERRMKTLRDLAARSLEARHVDEACHIAGETLKANPYDIPFALLYLVDKGKARLVCATGIEEGTEISPASVDLRDSQARMTPWPLARVEESGKAQLVEVIEEMSAHLPEGPWKARPQAAMIMHLTISGQDSHSMLLVLGISPHRALDDSYQDFFNLVAAQIASTLSDTLAYEQQQKRAEALAELDRAKTAFFSNVSHEFRTPLTLMLGPLEDALARTLDPAEQQELEVVHRNGLRLLKMVNTLLDFSRIEAGRIHAVYQPTDLAALTAELASTFRSAIERVGMKLIVECPALPEHIFVDLEMWEKIVLNLLSNAFKFTFEGAITVSLSRAGDSVELRVCDTGTGIPEAELPNLFERFHRIRGAQARTHEGTGIGLALVQELAKLHGGSVSVESQIGEGTTFTVTIPMGSAHLPADRISSERMLPSATDGAKAYVEEAMRWLPTETVTSAEWQVTSEASQVAAQESNSSGAQASDPSLATRHSSLILLADDNADMREYIKRILGQHWIVEAVSDGKAALEAARERVPDLVLSDVMMPGLDGFELLRELRADPHTRSTPIILLSARAGEESRIEGLEAGADDYLVKPFSARELIARVGSHINIARIRSEAEEQIRRSQERLQLTSDTVPALISYLDTERRYLFCNRTYLEWFGLTPEDIIGKHIWEVVGAEAWETIRPYMDAAFGGKTADFETEAHYKQGGARWIHAVYTPHRGEDGSVIGVVIMVSDITARKKAEEDRERLLTAERVAREAADAASRAKDEFLATVSHELRTPLNAMLGWARLLSSGTLNDETAKRGLKSIEQNAKAQAQLIEDLLDVSRIISGKLRLNTEPVQVSRVVEAALDSVRPSAEARGVTLQVSLDPDAGPVSGDAGRLQQVVWNLLSNAVKFTSKDGRVQVSLRRIDSQVEIQVTDTGQGIDPEFLPYVFDRFRQADGSPTRIHGGLGLGLAIVRHITELHGGSVSADSPGRGQGATFCVRLPMMDVYEKALGVEHSSPRSRGGADLHFQPSLALEGVKVLIVDDEPQTLLLLSTVLTESGAYVKTASSAEEGFSVVQSWRPGVIVSDIGMPGEDGYEFIKRVRKWAREHGTWIPSVALTAYARAEDRLKTLASGYQIHVPKPVEPAELIAVITSLVERPTTPWNTNP